MYRRTTYNIGHGPPRDQQGGNRWLWRALALSALLVLAGSVAIPLAKLAPGPRGSCWCRTLFGVVSYGPALNSIHFPHSKPGWSSAGGANQAVAGGWCYREAPQHCHCDTTIIPTGHLHLDRGPHIIVAERGRGSSTSRRLSDAKRAVNKCSGCANLCDTKHVSWGKVVPRIAAVVCLLASFLLLSAAWRFYNLVSDKLRRPMSVEDAFAKPATYTL